MNTPAKRHQSFLDAEERSMRKALGLEIPGDIDPPKFKHKSTYRQRLEVTLRCVTPSGEVINFFHNEETVSELLAVCEARKKARKYNLRVLWTVEVNFMERTHALSH